MNENTAICIACREGRLPNEYIAILIAFWEGVLSSHKVLLKGNLIARVNYQVTNPYYRALPENTA